MQITKKAKRRECKICHKRFFKISRSGLCEKCLAEKLELSRLEIKHREGPIYEKWKKKLLESLEK